MKKVIKKNIFMIPLVVWIVIIPIVVKAKFYPNPLAEYPWYSQDAIQADFFLYYKSMLVTFMGGIMLLLLAWQISKIHTKSTLITHDTNIFIPIILYLVFVVLSSMFSEYKYFCIHGMPDQFETVWNQMSYVVVIFYCFYFVANYNFENNILLFIFVGATLVGLICILQYFKIDIYRLIYASKGYSFTFEEGTVYGPFYNINYVGYYILLFLPLFIMFLLFYPTIKVKVASAILSLCLLLALVGAESVTAQIACVAVSLFSLLFILFKKAQEKNILYLPIIIILAGILGVCIILVPHIFQYVQTLNTEKTDLENIYTHDENVEIDYKGQKLFISMQQNETNVSFILSDQYQAGVPSEMIYSEDGYYSFQILDERFKDMRIMPVVIKEDPIIYGFMVTIDGQNWCFTNQMTEDHTYYYYTKLYRLMKLTDENVSADFAPLVNVSRLASGRGYIWNKTIALLKDYILLGSGADTFTLIYPNDDVVDKYNNGYDNMFITKPHNLYLQIAVQSGMLSLICFLVFYGWYFVSSLCLYFREKFDQPLNIFGFAIMLGTLGYMIAGLTNDSTITVAPLYWALMGIGIGINHKLRFKKN